MIVRLYYLILYIIEGFVYLQYCSTVFESERPKLQKYMSIIVLYSILFLISFWNNPLCNILSFAIANFLFLFIIYRPKWYIALFNSVLSTAIMCLCELIILLVVPTQISYSFADLSELGIWIIPAVFSKVMYFFIMHLFALFSSRNTLEGRQKNHSIILLAAVPAVSVFVTFTFLRLCTDYPPSPLLAQIVSASTLFLLALNVIIWESYSYSLDKNSEMMNLQLLLQKESDTVEYYKMLTQQNENQSQFIHDIKNHLYSILLLNEKGNNENISSYIENLISSSGMQTSARICGNEFLNALLNRYSAQCHTYNISFYADIRDNAYQSLNENDMTSLFCNLLDNAVESASKVPDSIIELSMYKQHDNDFSIITVVNSCQKNPFSSTRKTLVTTKANHLHHGYGLKVIERIVKNHDGKVQNYYSEETHTFHTIITLKES